MNAVLALSDAARAKGLVTFSSGNHGQAVALAARDAGVTSHIVMPEDAPAVKVEAVRALGGEVSFAGKTTDDRFKLACLIAERTGGTIIPPFDDANVIAGQGTATVELIERRPDWRDLDAVLVRSAVVVSRRRVSGGRRSPDEAKVIAVEPTTADIQQGSSPPKRRHHRACFNPRRRSQAHSRGRAEFCDRRQARFALRIVRRRRDRSSSLGAFDARQDLGRALGACALAAALSASCRGGSPCRGVLSWRQTSPCPARQLIDRHAG